MMLYSKVVDTLPAPPQLVGYRSGNSHLEGLAVRL
jgi:hypothetical protein